MRVDVRTRDLARYLSLRLQEQLGRSGFLLLTRGLSAGLFLVLIFPFAVSFLTGERYSWSAEYTAVLLSSGGLWILWYVFGFWKFLRYRRPSFSRRPTRYALTLEGLEWENDVDRGTTRWAEIADLADDGELIAARSLSGIAHLIPKCFFESPEAAEQFLAAARNYWRAARPF